MALVLDASVALSWLFADEFTPDTESLLHRVVDEKVVVPGHWKAEVANGALTGERRGRVSRERTSAWILQLADLDLESDRHGTDAALSAILPLARSHRLTIYDALYLELAERRGMPLATFDADLAAAARSVGIEVLGAL